MNYQIYVYLILSCLSAFALSGVNFEKFMKKNRYFETRFLVLLLSLALGYIVTKFIFEFL